MARKYGQRLKPLYVLDILREKSDEEHPVTAAYICGELEKGELQPSESRCTPI